MTDLSPEARALIDAARPGLGPDPATVKRMRGGVAAKVSGGLLASGFATKLGIAAVVAALGVAAILGIDREPSSAPISIELPHAPLAPSTATAVDPPPPPAPEAAPVVAPSRAAPTRVNLDREVTLIDRATASLAAGEPQRAITTIRLYDAETAGRGQLAEEAAAIEVEATCTAHLPVAAKKLAAFYARFPQSAQRSRLTTTCQE